MTEIQQNRYDQLIRRVNNIVSPGSIVGDALHELFPVIDVERVPGELLVLMGTRLASGRGNVLAGGGVRPQIQLFNPIGSATVITVTSLIISSVQAQTLSWGIGPAAFTTLTARGSLRDTRLRQTASNTAVGELRTQTTAVPAAGEVESISLAQTPVQYSDENSVAVLSPGFGLNVEGTTNATQIIASFLWRERTLEAAEESPVG